MEHIDINMNYIDSTWVSNGNVFENDIILSESDGFDIDAILRNASQFISIHSAPNGLTEGRHTRTKQKKYASENTGLSPSEYVAHNDGNQKSAKSGKSFYDNTHTIQMTINENTVYGSVRISNHEVDLGKWAMQCDLDFGISIVLYENDSELIGNNIVNTPGRQIHIYEYVKKVNRNNKAMLNQIISKIIDFKNNKKSWGTEDIIGGVSSKDVTNESFIDTKIIRKIIQEEIVWNQMIKKNREYET